MQSWSQSHQQLMEITSDQQVNMYGPSQLGGGNTQVFNPRTYTNCNNNNTSNKVTYNNCNFYYITNVNKTGNTPIPPYEQIKTPAYQTVPGLPNMSPTGRSPEQCLQHMGHHIPAIRSSAGQRCPSYGQSTISHHSPPVQPVLTEVSQEVKLVDSKGRELQAGDGVVVETENLSWFWAVYVGNAKVVFRDEKTQRVEIKTLDVKQPYHRLTPDSQRWCELFSPEDRVKRAESCVGRPSPLREMWSDGRDFVYWTWTGFDLAKAWNNGFRLLGW